jgi:hypothetical protein
VTGKRCCSEPCTAVTNDPSLDDDTALGCRAAHGERHTASPARTAGTAATRTAPKRGIACALRNLQDACNQRFGFSACLQTRSAAPVAHSTRLNRKVVIAHNECIAIKSDGCANVRIAGIVSFGASRAIWRLALFLEDFCALQPPQPYAVLSRHRNSPFPPIAFNLLQHPPIPAMTLKRGSIAITAAGSPKRVQRGRCVRHSRSGQVGITRRRRSFRMRRHHHHPSQQRADFASKLCELVAPWMRWRRLLARLQIAASAQFWRHRHAFRQAAVDRDHATAHSAPAPHYRQQGSREHRSCHTFREDSWCLP